MLRKLLRAMGAGHGSGRGETPQASPTPPAAGWVEQQLGRLARGMIEEVEREARDACAREPRCAEAHFLAGKALLARGEFSTAATELRRAIELKPGEADFHHDLGIASRGLGEKRLALTAFDRALAIRHDHISAAYHAGLTHAELGEFEEAKDCYSLALAFDPLSSAARTDLARLFMDQDKPQAALDLLREAVTGNIADCAVYSCLAKLLVQVGEVRAAEDAYRAAIERFPDNAALLVNFGMLRLGQLGDATGAEALFRRAIEIDPGSLEAQANLGLSLQEQGRFDEAIEHYERRLALQPEVLEYRWNRGVVHLMQGNFDAGWRDYELRKSRSDAGGVHEKFALPDWDGSPLGGRSILIYGEQGLGDEIMFASCLPEVIAQSNVCVIECDDRLQSLYRRSFPRARIVARTPGRGRDWRAAYPGLEIQSAIGSLPRFLRRSESDFPAHRGYLVADGEATARWRQRLEASGAATIVGIAWRGGTLRTRGPLRSLALDELGDLLGSEGVTFVMLQRGLTEEERAQIATQTNLFNPEAIADLDDLAALVRALDLVISVPSTIAHLAGALGQPVWILLTRSPEWRYLWRGDRMPWYPAATLLRQPHTGGWGIVMRETFTKLQQWKR
jgi:tetratricopeptide (TPR) repeat protein